ncbi:DinB superfamily protein [Paenibacillus sp. UNC496MF]|uniref:DinB family protein n=1 Tax=Paenibacillus sp. UNC496MF TaxID=1502753 RepID=UPI0008F30DBE|nr:DinB family protein [Paenibacillus sp. UNC496MF]SFJ03034.1 DinB superfamily protein [Paenibacillus sp. UNC496MF]
MTANPIETLLFDYSELHKQLMAKIANLTEDQLTWKAATGVWSVTEVLSHLTDHAIVVGFRIREILAASEAKLPAFNQNAWVASTRANESAASEILAFYDAYLTYNLHLLKRLAPEDWAKTGLNAKGETVSLRDVVWGFVKHVLNHIGQIDRIALAYVVV